MMQDFEWGLVVGLIIALIFCSLIGAVALTSDYSVEAGKTIIIRNASYKCNKTNELIKE